MEVEPYYLHQQHSMLIQYDDENLDSFLTVQLNLKSDQLHVHLEFSTYAVDIHKPVRDLNSHPPIHFEFLHPDLADISR